MIAVRFCLLTFILFLTPLSAAVIDSGQNGFTSRTEVRIAASSVHVWAAMTNEVAAWWDPEHTLSGDANRLSIDAQPQGCFCEDFGENAGVVHLSVTTVSPPTMLRLSGGLGPLGLMGVSGNMTWEFVADGDGTIATLTYAVGGYRKGGLGTLAVPVDAVLGAALGRLKTFVETGRPDATMNGATRNDETMNE